MRNFFGILLCLNLLVVKGQGTVPEIELLNIDNQYVSLQNLKAEKYTILDFWASWCKPCVNSIPELSKIQQDYSDKGISIVGINIDGPRNQSKIRPLSISYGINYPVLLDPDMDLMTELGLNSIPALIIMDSDNKIVYSHLGYKLGDENIIRDELDKLLNNGK